MKADTLKKAIQEAERFIKAAKAVELEKIEQYSTGKVTQYIATGKASGAARRASMDLSRVLADLRQGR